MILKNIKKNKKRRILIAFLLAPLMLVFSTITTSNITHRYDIIPSLNNKVSALDCYSSGRSELICDVLDLGSFEFFEIMPFAKNYEGTQSSLVVIIVDLLSCLFVLSIIFAFVIALKIMVQEMAPWGEESAEKFKRAKNKYLELGKAFIIPAIIFVVIIAISSIFGVKAPLGINYLLEGLGLPTSVTTTGEDWVKRTYTSKFNRCMKGIGVDEDDASVCLDTVLYECYNSARDKFSDESLVILAKRSCDGIYQSLNMCISECGTRYSVTTTDYNNCIKRCN